MVRNDERHHLMSHSSWLSLVKMKRFRASVSGPEVHRGKHTGTRSGGLSIELQHVSNLGRPEMGPERTAPFRERPNTSPLGSVHRVDD